jgi:tetratricopeptide (TPR) repeat protein
MRTLISVIITLWAAASALLMPQVFIHYTFIKHQLHKLLDMEVDPAFSGGREIGHFLDAVGDDNGEGGLTYPRHSAYTGKTGVLDLVKYTVHQPQTGARWSREKDYLQVSFTFAQFGNELQSILGFCHPIIHLYLDIDGKKSGNTETAFPRCELVCFDPDHPWDFLIEVHGFSSSGLIFSADKTFQGKAAIFADTAKKKLTVRIPLECPGLKQILDGRNTYHYVLVGAYDPLAHGGFMPVKTKAGIKHGGGARSPLSPRIYDYVAPQGKEQKRMLSSYNEKAFSYAVIFPLEVTPDLCAAAEKHIDAAKITELKKQVKEETDVFYHENMRIIKQAGRNVNSEDIKLAIAFFNVERVQQAEEILDRILEGDANHALANAYKGAVTAGKAHITENLGEKLEYVEQSFVYLDRGAALARSDDEKIHCLLCRAEVGMAVPEDVFARNHDAEQDLKAVIGILHKQEEKNSTMIADMYIKLACCYLNQAKSDEAEIAFLKAQNRPRLSAWAQLRLAQHGY